MVDSVALPQAGRTYVRNEVFVTSWHSFVSSFVVSGKSVAVADPVAMHIVPRLPRKRGGAQGTPGQCILPHACHAKEAEPKGRQGVHPMLCRFENVSKKMPGRSHQQQQQSKLEIKIGFLVGFQKGCFGPRGTWRLILRHFRREIRLCFAVSDVFRKRCLVVGFLL